MLEEGRYRPAAETAEAEGVTRSFVNRLLRLTLLAPDIVEAILEGRQPKAMQLEKLTDTIPSEWEKERKALLSGAARARAGRALVGKISRLAPRQQQSSCRCRQVAQPTAPPRSQAFCRLIHRSEPINGADTSSCARSRLERWVAK
jgi:hypothetical protein